MENLLLLVHRTPYPPNKGDKIRSYHLLKHLSQRYHVHLGTFVDDPEDWQHVPLVEALCTESHFAAMNTRTARIRSLGALLVDRSLSFAYYRDRGLQDWVDELMRRKKIDRIMIYSSPMAQYARAYPQARRIVDFVDVDSDKWRQYADKKPWPLSWLYRHESKQLLRADRQVARDCEASLFVSEPEAQLFRTLAPESATKIGHVSMGVDVDYYAPGQVFDNPYPTGARVLIFTGNMDYWPNIDAVRWFAASVFPALRAAFPGLYFYIVGARPAPSVAALAQEAGIVVTGRVPDVRPFITHADISVAPLRIARGVQTKVLEAMAMAKSVVVSPQALEGISATPGTELLLADDAPAFINALTALLHQPDPAIGRAACERIRRDYGWASNLAQIDALLEARSGVAAQAPAGAVATPAVLVLPLAAPLQPVSNKVS